MQNSEVFSYQIVNKTSIKPASLSVLKQCIKSVIDNSADLQSQASISSVSNFQNCVTSQYKTAMITNSEGYYINSLFSLLSFDCLEKNTKNYLLLMDSLIGTELGDKSNKAMNISKDIICIQPDTDPIVWNLLEKILVWLTNPLGTSMQLTLHPLRDMIWKWYFSNDQVSVISSLCLLNIFFRRFYALLVPAFDSFQSLLIRSIQDPEIAIREQAIKVLKSALSILGSPVDGTIKALFDKFRLLIETEYSPTLVDSVISVFEHTISCCSIMHFTTNMLDIINPNDPASFALIPFIYKCTPSLFSVSDLTRLFDTLRNTLIQMSNKKALVYKAIGTLGFQLTPNARSRIDETANLLLSMMAVDTPDAAYAFLSLVDPTKDLYIEKLNSILKLPISTYLARGIRSFIKQWPSFGHMFRSYIICELNIVILTKTEPAKLAKAFSILSMFTFEKSEISEETIDQYSLALRHQSPLVREKCAYFLVRQQAMFPNAVYRLIAFVSIETIPDLRVDIFNRIVIVGEASDLITPLHSLLSDRQNEIVYRSLALLCSISSAAPFISEFTSDLINRLNRSAELEKHYISCLLTLAKFNFRYVRPYSDFICDYLLKFEKQTSSSLKLISLLVDEINFEPLIPKLSTILATSLNRNSSNKKTSAVLDLFSVLLSSKGFRVRMRDSKEVLFNNMIDLFSATDSPGIRTKILDVLSRIGMIRPHTIRRLFTQPVKTKMIIPEQVDQFTSLSIYAASFAISNVIDILESDGMLGLQGIALETLLIILKKFRGIPAIIHNEILDKLCRVIRSMNTTTTPIILHNVPTLIRIFEQKSEVFIPDIIELVFENWGKVDMATLLTDIEWMVYKLPSVVAPYAFQLLSLFVPSLSVAEPKEAESIFVAIACFGKLAAPVDVMIIENLIPWIEGHIHETETALYALEKFADILKNFSTKKFFVRIYRTMMMITKENPLLIPKVIDVLTVIAIQTKDDFGIFIPEILQIFDLDSYDTFWKIIECISTHAPLPDKLVQKYMHPQIGRMFQDFQAPSLPQFQYELPKFEMPSYGWDALEWNRWVNMFVNLIIAKSPSKAISACVAICDRNHNVRSALFPVSFAFCLSEADDPEPLHSVLQTAMQSNGIPLYARSLFLSAIEILMLHSIDVRVPENVIAEAAVATGNLSLALRCYESRYKQTGEAKNLVKVNLMMCKQHAARSLINPKTYEEAEMVGDWKMALEFLKPTETEKREHCLEKLNMFDTLSKLNCRGERTARVALFTCSLQFKNYASNDFEKAILSLMEGQSKVSLGLVQKIRSEVFQSVLGDNNYNFADISSKMTYASLLVDIEDASRILSLRADLIKSTSLEKARGEDKISKLFEMWDEKFDYGDPPTLFLSIIIRSLVLPIEKSSDSLVRFLRMYNSDERVGELKNVAFRRLHALDPVKYELINSRLNKGPEDLKKVIDENHVEGPWREELGEWFLKNGDYNNAKDYIVHDSLSWAKCCLMIYNETKENSLLSDAINILLDKGELVFIIALLQKEESRENVSKLLDEKIDALDIDKWTYYLPFIVSRLHIPIFKKLFDLIIKKNEAKSFYAMLPSLIRSGAEQLEGYESSKYYVQFAKECIRLSEIYHEKIVSATGRLLKTRSVDEMISLYQNVEDSDVYRQFVEENSCFEDCRKALLTYTKTNSHRDYEGAISLHLALFNNVNLPNEYSLSCISQLDALAGKSKIVQPFNKNRVLRFGTVTVSENYSKTIRTIAPDGEVSSFTIRNRDGAFYDQRITFFMNEVSRFFRSSVSDSIAPPLTSILPLTESISLESGAPSLSVDEAVKSRRRKLSVRVSESDLATSHFNDLEGDARLRAFEAGLKATKGDDLEKVITRSSSSIINWAQRRNQFIGSLATKCMTGYVIGVEERYLSNIMLCFGTAQVYNVYFKYCFNELKTPMPFRLTRILTNALDAACEKGAIRTSMKKALSGIRRDSDALFAILQASIYDDDLKWTEKKEEAVSYVKKTLYESNGSVDEDVDHLIKEATAKSNISLMSTEWNPWW